MLPVLAVAAKKGVTTVMSNDTLRKAVMIFILIIAIRFFAWPWLRKQYVKLTHKFEQQKNIDDLDRKIDYSNLSYNRTQYPFMADQLKEAFLGPWYNPTDEAAIYKIFGKLNTSSDVAQLVKDFGVVKEKTLPQWIIYALDSSERKHLDSIFKSKGINFNIS